MNSQKFASYNLRLKIAMVECGFTQRRLARRVRIEETRFCRIVRGSIVPDTRERRKLATALGRPEADLFPVAS